MLKARRHIEITKFKEVFKRLRARQAKFSKYSAAAYFIFQFHLIGRVNDIAKFSHDDLTPHTEYNFALKLKTCWSKNVLDERSASDQIVFAARDPRFCTILALGIYLE